jgi:hypothetical protein
VFGYTGPTPNVQLQPGPDADITPRWELRNLFRDPSAITIDNFTASTNVTSPLTISSTVSGYVGTTALRAQVTAAGSANILLANAAKGYVQVAAGATYNVSTYIRSSVSRQVYVAIRWYDAQGVLLKTDSGSGSPVSSPTGNWNTRINWGATAPKNASYMIPVVATLANTAGQFHYLDGIQITETSGPPVPFFYGTAPSDAFYTYAWEADTNDSISQRGTISNRCARRSLCGSIATSSDAGSWSSRANTLHPDRCR